MRLMNAFGARAEHVIVSAMAGQLSARDALHPAIQASFPDDAPPLTGRPTPWRLFRLARYMRRFDLVLTYNWGAFDAVMAKRLFGGPPLIHHEDGFNEDEAERLKPHRNIYRRIGLSAAYRLVVPSRRLEAIARDSWGQSPCQVMRIPNGIDVARFAQPAPGSIPGIEGKAGRILIGTVAGLRRVKNLPRLVRAFAAAGADADLVIVGAGPEGPAIHSEAAALGVGDRLFMPGFLADPARYIGLFDIFALSSDSEQFPISLVEAMAAGLPVVATAVGDVATMVSEDNRPLIVAPDDEPGFAAALSTLVERADLRRSIGRANRAKALAEYEEAAIIRGYAELYGEAIGQPRAFEAAEA